MKRIAILLLLLASTTQAFVAQTHVHAARAAQAAAHQASVDAGDQLPGNGGEAGCLLCQVAAHGAAALASNQPAVLLVAQQYAVATFPESSDPVSLPLSHSWLSRGPPRS